MHLQFVEPSKRWADLIVPEGGDNHIAHRPDPRQAATRPRLTRVALLTSSALPSLYGDEQELPARFAAAGVTAEPVVWSDPAVDWASYDLVVIRSTWDYFQRIGEFRDWLDRIEEVACRCRTRRRWCAGTSTSATSASFRSRGVRIVPTRFFDAGARVDLPSLIGRRAGRRRSSSRRCRAARGGPIA